MGYGYVICIKNFDEIFIYLLKLNIFLAIIILKILNKWRKKMLYNSLGILILEMENM